MQWVALFSAIAITMVAQTLLKTGAGAADFAAQMLRPSTIFGLGLYGAAALLYIIALRRVPLSVALPCTAISYIAAVLIGHFHFGEPLGVMHITAVGLIGAGVVLLALA